MIDFNIILIILIAHFIGDFVLQSDKIASNKSKNSEILYVHCWLYSIPFYVSGTIISIIDSKWNSKECILFGLWILFNIHFHFVIDYVTSRITSKLWVNNKRHLFFTAIGADLLIHYIVLLVTYKEMFK